MWLRREFTIVIFPPDLPIIRQSTVICKLCCLSEGTMGRHLLGPSEGRGVGEWEAAGSGRGILTSERGCEVVPSCTHNP